MEAIETTSCRNNLLLAILAGIQIVLTLVWNDWPLRVKDVTIALLWAIVFGVASTIAYLKVIGTIQAKPRSEEDARLILKRRVSLVIAALGIVVMGWLWILMK